MDSKEYHMMGSSDGWPHSTKGTPGKSMSVEAFGTAFVFRCSFSPSSTSANDSTFPGDHRKRTRATERGAMADGADISEPSVSSHRRFPASSICQSTTSAAEYGTKYGRIPSAVFSASEIAPCLSAGTRGMSTPSQHHP